MRKINSREKKQLCKQTGNVETRRNVNKLAVNNFKKVSNVQKIVIAYFIRRNDNWERNIIQLIK